jgi:hypothetical protein
MCFEDFMGGINKGLKYLLSFAHSFAQFKVQCPKTCGILQILRYGETNIKSKKK